MNEQELSDAIHMFQGAVTEAEERANEMARDLHRERSRREALEREVRAAADELSQSEGCGAGISWDGAAKRVRAILDRAKDQVVQADPQPIHKLGTLEDKVEEFFQNWGTLVKGNLHVQVWVVLAEGHRPYVSTIEHTPGYYAALKAQGATVVRAEIEIPGYQVDDGKVKSRTVKE